MVDAMISYIGPQGSEDFDVLAGQIVTKEMIFTTSTQPAAVEIKAYDKVNNSLISINGRKSIFVNLTLTKVITEIEISDSGKLCERLFSHKLTILAKISWNTTKKVIFQTSFIAF